ncbi:MAG: hypothetical protein PHI90_06435 [Clostridia bacterium]|nr:hypothetical protein [Clostridia bacterium]MDD4048447.1 hypothetical protein [Clostridia bacterium]
MEKAIFFSGYGTSYVYSNNDNKANVKKSMEIFPETISALCFLEKRGYLLVLVTPDFMEYELIKNKLKDKIIKLEYWNTKEDELDKLLKKRYINMQESFYLTDGYLFQDVLHFGWKTILVLTGKGVDVLNSLEPYQLNSICDICKDIYAAAISVVVNK